MINLTTKQIEQAQDLIEKYGFCTLETQKELQGAGFFEKTKCNLSLCVDSNNETIEIWGNAKESIVLSRFTLIPMPQMHEVWKQLPKVLRTAEAGSVPQILEHNEQGLIWSKSESVH